MVFRYWVSRPSFALKIRLSSSNCVQNQMSNQCIHFSTGVIIGLPDPGRKIYGKLICVACRSVVILGDHEAWQSNNLYSQPLSVTGFQHFELNESSGSFQKHHSSQQSLYYHHSADYRGGMRL